MITLDGASYKVVGVLPADFWFLDVDNRILLPLSFAPDDGRRTRANHFLSVVSRLRAGVGPDAASADLAALNLGLAAESVPNRSLSFTVTPLQRVVVSNVETAMLVLLASVSILLLIACVNLAGLASARAVGRRKQAAVRRALGATSGQLLGPLIVETGTLATLGAALGVSFAYTATTILRAMSPTVLPRASQIHLDGFVLMVAATLTVVSALAIVAAPAWQVSRADITRTLNDDARGSTTGRIQVRTRAILVVVQIAFAVVLLVGGGLMVRSLLQLTRVDLGFNPDHVLTFSVSLPPTRYLDVNVHPAYGPEATVKADVFFRDVVDNIRRLASVQAVGATAALPATAMGWDKVLTLWDRPLPATVSELPQFEYRPIAGDYFLAMGIPLRGGRLFNDRDTMRSAPVVLVNEEFVRRHFQGQDADALGKEMSLNPPRKLLPAVAVTADTPSDPPRFTFIGVVGDARNASVNQPADPMVYCPYSQGAEDTLTMSFAIRTTASPASLVPGIRDALRSVDSNQPIANVTTMDDALGASLGRPQLETDVLAAFGLIALVLATCGVYALMAYLVAQRRAEIGLRIALGCEPTSIALAVLRQSGGLTMLGITIGSGAAVVLGRAMRSMVFGIGVIDPAVFAGVGATFIAAALLAGLVPALRAARIDPVAALK